MCLQTTWKVPKVADKDITVYKILVLDEDTIKAPMFTFVYELGKVYSTHVQKRNNENASSYDRAAGNAKCESTESYISIAEGFHSALERGRLEPNRYQQLYECTIPKGSLYFIGFTGLVVSNQIIINRQL